MSTNYEKAFQLIQKNVDLFISGFCPYSECSIKKIEQILKSKMPSDYIQFLRTFGLLNFGSKEVFGIFRNEIDGIYQGNMIRETLDARNTCRMPSDLIIIEDTGWDVEICCLQINENDPDKSPVVIYVHPTVPIEVIAPDFGTFLLELVEQEIKFAKEERKLQEKS